MSSARRMRHHPARLCALFIRPRAPFAMDMTSRRAMPTTGKTARSWPQGTRKSSRGRWRDTCSHAGESKQETAYTADSTKLATDGATKMKQEERASGLSVKPAQEKRGGCGG